jgi:hypothetical protein
MISPYQGSDEEMRNICSYGIDPITSFSSFSTRNFDTISKNTNDFLDLAEEKYKLNS